MNSSVEDEIGDLKDYIKTHGGSIVHLLLSAFLMWLFGNLVFIPIAVSLSWQAEIFCSLIFFIVFTVLIVRALPSLKKLIDTFSVFPARKYILKRGLSYEESVVVSKQVLYMISLVILYLLYLPFLSNFHPAVNGIALILVLIWIFFSTLRILLISSQKIFEWLHS